MTAVVKRSIRLKEFPANSKDIYYPSERFFSSTSLDPKKAYYIETDSEGYLSNSHKIEFSRSIYLLGDSSVENLFCNEGERFSNILQELIIKNDYCNPVVNTGYSGGTTLTSLNVLINKIAIQNAGIVILFLPSNDEKVLRCDEKYWSQDKYFGNIVPESENRISPSSKIIEDVEDMKKLVLAARYFCDLFGIKFFLGSVLHNGNINNLLSDFSLSEGIDYIDVGNNFFEVKDFYDNVHLNEIGSSKLGHFIFDKVKNYLDVKDHRDDDGSVSVLKIIYSSNEDLIVDFCLLKDDIFICNKDNPFLKTKISIRLQSTNGRDVERNIVLKSNRSLTNEDLIISDAIGNIRSFSVACLSSKKIKKSLFLKNFHRKYISFNSENKKFEFFDELKNINCNPIYIEFNEGLWYLKCSLLEQEKDYFVNFIDDVFLSLDRNNFSLKYLFNSDFQCGVIRNFKGLNMTCLVSDSYYFKVDHMKSFEKIYPISIF